MPTPHYVCCLAPKQHGSAGASCVGHYYGWTNQTCFLPQPRPSLQPDPCCVERVQKNFFSAWCSVNVVIPETLCINSVHRSFCHQLCLSPAPSSYHFPWSCSQSAGVFVVSLCFGLGKASELFTASASPFAIPVPWESQRALLQGTVLPLQKLCQFFWSCLQFYKSGWDHSRHLEVNVPVPYLTCTCTEMMEDEWTWFPLVEYRRGKGKWSVVYVNAGAVCFTEI